MEEKRYQVGLTLYELQLLTEEAELYDHVLPDSVLDVMRLAEQEAGYGFEFNYINEIIAASVKTGRFAVEYTRMSYCPHCKELGSYLKYKSGRNKGRLNYKKPTYLSGYLVNPGFVRFGLSGDICKGCEQKYDVFNNVRKYILDNDLPVELVGRDFAATSKFNRDPISVCFKCKEEMQESKMGSSPALLSGQYKSTCPHCGAKAEVFGLSHKSTDKFVMVRRSPRCP
jgi:hypothetical protein